MYNVLKDMFAMTINIGIHGHPLAHPRREVTGLQPPKREIIKNTL